MSNPYEGTPCAKIWEEGRAAGREIASCKKCGSPVFPGETCVYCGEEGTNGK